jgi:RNA recognition motif-containing protein
MLQHIVKTNKGKAYIDFETQEGANKAISYMDNVRNLSN